MKTIKDIYEDYAEPGIVMRHKDYIDIFKSRGEFDGDCWIIWLNEKFWEVLEGECTDILGAYMSKDIHHGGYGLSFLTSSPDDKKQVFEPFGSLPYHIQKQLINYIKP